MLARELGLSRGLLQRRADAITASLNRSSTGNGFVITWPAVAGDTYQVQSQDVADGAAVAKAAEALLAEIPTIDILVNNA